MSPVTDKPPAQFFPLLPVVRVKDRWKNRRDGTPYKVRLCLDLKCGGYNESLKDWPFRYRGLDSIAESVRRGDWLATIDISRFYLRLPAGQRLRAAQWFQEPSTYASSTHNNEHMQQSKMRFRQLLSVAFGLKSAPAYASIISAELGRILESFGVAVAGVYVDDFLLRGATKAECERSMKLAAEVCSALGVPINDKTRGPVGPGDGGIPYLGVCIDTGSCTMTVTEEHRQFTVDQLTDVLARKRLSLEEAESLCGTLTWIACVVDRGRPRRNALYQAVKRMKQRGKCFVRPRGELLRQLKWWRNTLKSGWRLTSRFWDVQPDTPLVCSDASGDDGWGACTSGMHIVGPWPAEWRQSVGSDAPHMLFKEMVAPVVSACLLAPWMQGKVLACALDNAGVAFTLNSLSSGCSLTRELLRSLADTLCGAQLSLIGGHAHRERNTHTDALSHSLSADVWQRLIAGAATTQKRRLEFHFAVLDVRSGSCFLATWSCRKPYHARNTEPVAANATHGSTAASSSAGTRS